MTENKGKKPQDGDEEKLSRHDKRSAERQQRQAIALRANLKKRKTQIRQRDSNADRNQ